MAVGRTRGPFQQPSLTEVVHLLFIRRGKNQGAPVRSAQLSRGLKHLVFTGPSPHQGETPLSPRGDHP